MARKVLVQLVDDLDGKELGEDGSTVTFAFQGTAYEIDLSAGNAEKLEKALTKYIEAARKVSNAKGRTAENRRVSGKSKGLVDASTGVNPKEARAWAVSAGLMPEGSRGRIPSEIVEKYKASLAS